MSKIKFITLLSLIIFSFQSCKKDDGPGSNTGSANEIFTLNIDNTTSLTIENYSLSKNCESLDLYILTDMDAVVEFGTFRFGDPNYPLDNDPSGTWVDTDAQISGDFSSEGGFDDRIAQIFYQDQEYTSTEMSYNISYVVYENCGQPDCTPDGFSIGYALFSGTVELTMENASGTDVINVVLELDELIYEPDGGC